MGEKMEREEAIDYLDRKGKIEVEKKVSKEDEEEVKKVMKEGKIYGDPTAEIDM